MEANYLNSPSPSSFFTIPIEFDDMLMESLMDFNVDDQESIIPLGSIPPVLSQSQDTIDDQEEDEDDHQLTKSSLIDLLILGAEAVEAENFDQATTITGTLHQLLLLDQENNLNNALHRLAYYFTLGLHLRTSTRSEWCRHDQQEDMTASQMMQELTPYVKFAHFTANQAILEAMDGQKELHIIDMDVMEGIQWPPLMADLSRTKNGVSLRIIALVWDGNNLKSMQRTGRRLLEFAESIGFALRFDTILVDNDQEDHHFDSIDQVIDSGVLVLNCMVYNTRLKRLKSVKKFLEYGSVVKRLCPKMVVMVEEEVFRLVMRMPCMSFVDFFMEALQHFTCVYDSFVCGFGERYKEGLRMVEREMLGPRIVDYVGEFERGFMWTLEGFKCIPLSVCNVSQAKFLVGVFSGGYGVEHVKGGLALSWKSRPLINVTVWVSS